MPSLQSIISISSFKPRLFHTGISSPFSLTMVILKCEQCVMCIKTKLCYDCGCQACVLVSKCSTSTEYYSVCDDDSADCLVTGTVPGSCPRCNKVSPPVSVLTVRVHYECGHGFVGQTRWSSCPPGTSPGEEMIRIPVESTCGCDRKGFGNTLWVDQSAVVDIMGVPVGELVNFHVTFFRSFWARTDIEREWIFSEL